MTRETREVLAGAGARHGRLRRSNGWANAAKALLTLVLVFAISGVSVAAYAFWGLTSELKTVDLGNEVKTPEFQTVGAGKQSLEGELTILLVGSDSRQDSIMDDGADGELNDVNLLLHVPADHQSATLVSFPRDMMVPIPSCPGPDGQPHYYSAMSEQMLNSAMMYGGLPCVVETISALTGLEIPYAAVVTFDGVINITNAIGGVEVCLAQPLYDEMTEFSLPEGNVSLQGVDALQFLRSRYGVGDGSDVSRISNQQVFMSALLRQMRSAETLSDPVKVYSLAKAGFASLRLSSSMASVQFMQALAGTVVNIDLDRVNFAQYPSSTHPYNPNRLTPNRYLGDQLMSVVMSGEPFEVAGHGEAAISAPVEPVAEAPAVPTTETPAAGAASGQPTTSTSPSPTPTPDSANAVVLPPGITGQKASDQTCSAGRTRW